jgi:hypothetical protein
VRRAALAVAGLLAATACRTPVPVLEPLSPGDPRPAALLAAWTQTAEARRGLRGRARIKVDASDDSVHLRGQQILVLERPARLRVEILGLLNQTLAVLVTDGGRFELFNAHDRSYRTGEVSPALLWEQAHLALRPEEAVDLLLGAPAPDPALRPAAAFGDDVGGVRIDLADASNAVRRRAGFDALGRLRWLEALDEAGRRLWRAEFRDYAQLGETAFAHTLDLEVDAGGTRAEIRLRDVELNPELPPDIFRLRAPQAGAGGSKQDG